MIGPADGALFFWIWSGFLLLMVGWVSAAFVWGIRSGQFADQERARWLPLDRESGTRDQEPGTGDRHTTMTPEPRTANRGEP